MINLHGSIVILYQRAVHGNDLRGKKMRIEEIATKERIEVLEALIAINKIVYTNEDFGKNYINMAFSLASLACLYYKDGEIDKAKVKICEAISLAERFDSLEENLVHTAPLLEGFEIEKTKIPYENEGKLADRIQRHIFQTHNLPIDII